MASYGYGRVSTGSQDLDSQIKQLEDAGCTTIFQEKFSGTKIERPEFQKLLGTLQPGDTLIVTKIDRFARSTIDAIQTVKMLLDRNIAVHILNMGLMENTPTGRLIFTIFSAFAEFERDLIVERTQEGRVSARKRKGLDFVEGRPPVYKRAQKEHALKLLESYSYSEVESLTGMSKSTLIRAKRKRDNIV